MTKFGRSFSIVRIPYCLKLLMQELLVMNVQMRIITEDNIDQLPSMSYSKNVYKVLKDGKGAMGVDDIIERNRLAVGLKPRDMTARKGAAGDGARGEEQEEEAAFGSRVYLPSRSEAEYAGEDTRPYAGIVPAGAPRPFDPDEHPEEIITDLDVDTRTSIRNLGWRFALKADIARQMRGKAGAGAGAGISASDITGEDLVLESVILDKNGEPTEKWTISGRQWVGDYPTRYPDGWLSEMLVYPDDIPISPSDMVEQLRKTRKPLNWVLAIIALIEKHGRNKMTSELEAVNVEVAENLRNIETNTKETERVSGEIDRAKREGNVAEEERLKVQMTRLMDERVKLDATRREMENRMTYEPKTPEYTSSTPMAEAAGPASDADRVRGAVASFNAKMLDKFAENPESIPSPSPSPRTPMSPEYTSMYSGGGGANAQRGGGRERYIPQIPMGVLESYLSSRYGGSAAAASQAPFSATSSAQGVMTGGGGFPTMNIPVVATMPMAGMMPMGGGGQATLGQATAAMGATQTAGGTNQLQQVGGGSPAPNAEGVKSFTIKM
jgi:hypothetical protein